MSLPETSVEAPPYRTVPPAELSGLTRLYADFLAGAGSVRSYFGPVFDDEEALHALAGDLARRAYPRSEMAVVLRELASDYGASAAARANIDRLESPDTLVVFAGQQVGLFTGPLYTIYKALAAERWAADLSRRLGRPLVPCFWLSTDDHDFAEVDHVFMPVGPSLRKIQYAPRPSPTGDPTGRIRIDASIGEVLEALKSSLPETDFTPDVFETLRACYLPGERLASAFGRLWYALFPESGLVPVSPCHRGFKALARPVMTRALADDRTLFAVYEETSRSLEAAGYHRQVHKRPDQTFLFYQQFKRHSIHHGERGGYVWEGAEPVTAAWLEHMLADRPDYFSPNVLLRPVVQNGLFPVLGVTLGPSEVAYYAQIGGLHDHFGVPRPAILPRTGATLVERSVARRIRKLDIRLPALCRDLDAEIARVLHQSFPSDLEGKFDAAEEEIGRIFERMRPELLRFDPTLDRPIRAAGARARREMRQVAQKAYAAHKRRQEETTAQIRRLALQLFPRGGLQERTFNIVYYWARYGPEFPALLASRLPAGVREHLIWEL